MLRMRHSLDCHRMISRPYGLAAALLAAASLTTSAAGALATPTTDPVGTADCEASDAVRRNAADASEDARARADQSTQYIHEEKQKAASDKNGKHEILMNFDRTSFKMDVPEVTVGSNKTQVPTVHIVMHRKSLHVPAPGQCKIGSAKVPEFRGLQVTMKTHDILVPCPVVKEVSFDLPEFAAGTTEVTLPAIKVEMKTREFSLNVPQFRERTPENEMRKHDQNIEEEVSRLKRNLADIENRYAAKATTEVKQLLDTKQAEALRLLEGSEQAALENIQKQKRAALTQLETAATQLKKAGVSDAQASELLRQKGVVSETMDRTVSTTRELFAAQRVELENTFNRLREKYLSTTSASLPRECQQQADLAR